MVVFGMVVFGMVVFGMVVVGMVGWCVCVCVRARVRGPTEYAARTAHYWLAPASNPLTRACACDDMASHP